MKAFRSWSAERQADYEPFPGSGTTLIAAETAGRVCLGLELSPAYVDVIVECWQGFEAEMKLKNTPAILKMPSGYLQQNPWLTISNKQLELMARFMVELGLPPSARCRIDVVVPQRPKPWEIDIESKYFK